MIPVQILWRARLVHQWRALVVLTVLVGLGAGVAMASFAGARRTASSFDRILTASRAPDVTSGHGLHPEEAIEIVEGFEGVQSHSHQVGFFGRVHDVPPGFAQFLIGWWDDYLAHGRPILDAGRHPDPARDDEVLLSSPAVDGVVEVGDELTVTFFESDFQGTQTYTFTVTGIGREANLVAADATEDRAGLLMTPAFTRAHSDDLFIWSSTRLSVTPGTDVEAVVAPQMVAAGWAIEELAATERDRVQDAIRPMVLSLVLLGVLVAVATLVVASQALARLVDTNSEDRESMAAMGFVRYQLRRLDTATVLTVVVPGALLGAATAVALSPLAPVGSVRGLEPDRGFDADWAVLTLGVTAVVAIAVVADRIRSRSAGSADATVPGSVLSGPATTAVPALATGVRFAVGSSRRTRRRFWSGAALTALAVAAVAGAVTFVGGLDRLASEPSRYGFGWDLVARNAWGEVPADEVRTLVADDPDIVAIAGIQPDILSLDSEVHTPVWLVEAITGDFWPTLVDGRTPRAADEILVGAETLRLLDASVGDTVDIGPEGARLEKVTIVGTAVFSPVAVAGLNSPRLDIGAAVPWEMRERMGDTLVGDAVPVSPAAFGEHPDIIVFDLADGAAADEVAARYPDGLPDVTGTATDWLVSVAPAEVAEAERTTPLMWGVVGLLALTVIAMIGHGLLTSVRRRREDYGVMKAIGFTRVQVAGSVAWQSLTVVVLALAVGIPVGVAAGRWTWALFARGMGVVDDPVVPLATLAVVVSGALATVAVVSSLPAMVASRVVTSSALHEE